MIGSSIVGIRRRLIGLILTGELRDALRRGGTSQKEPQQEYASELRQIDFHAQEIVSGYRLLFIGL